MNKRIIIVCGSIVLVMLFTIGIYHIKTNMIDSGAVQSIEVRIISMSDNEIVCTTDEEIESDDDLGFTHFDKGADIVVKPREGEGDFAGMKYQAGDHIDIPVFSCEDENGKSIITADRTQIHKVKK